MALWTYLISCTAIITLHHITQTDAGFCSNTDILAVLTGTSEQSWFPEPCVQCMCPALSGGTEHCVPIQCQAPDCPKGTTLTFTSDVCCPTCAQKYSDCPDKGLLHGEMSRDSSCTECACYNGEVKCTVLTCSDVTCMTGDQDDCCKSCTQDMCEDGSRLYSNGSSWSKGSCAVCTCTDGQKECYSRVCPPLDCKNAYTPEGACCPICPNDQCWTKNKLYENGETWNEDECTSCVCISGNPNCMKQGCFDEVCPRNMILMKEATQCCPTCVSSYGLCIDGEKSYYSGQIWNTSKCSYCMCNRGRIECQNAQCDQPQCEQDEYVYQPDGVCCPVCKQKEICVHDGRVRRTKLGEVWTVDVCRVCTCLNGNTALCFENDCNAGRPMHGALHEGRREFAYKELQDGLLYQHDGSAENDDHLIFQASKDDEFDNVLLPILIQPSALLGSVINEPLSVTAGESEAITRSYLLYEGGSVGPDGILYEITNKPDHGNVVMIIPQTPGTDLIGWADLGDGDIMREVVKFTQLDINSGYIHYQSNEATTTSTDYFMFKVKNLADDSVLEEEYFDTNILPPKLYDAPRLAPGVRLGIEVNERSVVTLTSADLAYEDSDTPAAQIAYKITSQPDSSQGYFEFVDSVEQPITEFTQSDINNQLVSYRAPDIEVTQTGLQFTVTFNVIDDSNMNLTDQNLLIKILPVDNQAPTVASKISINVPNKGETVVLTDTLLGVTDADTDKTDLKFIVLEPPMFGDVVYLQEVSYAVIRQGDEYSYSYILNGLVHYVHDNTDNFNDTFQLKISDNSQSVQVIIPVLIQHQDLEAPVRLGRSSMKITVSEDSTVSVDTSIIEYIDHSTDSSPSVVLFIVAVPPQVGQLLMDGEKLELGGTFSQDDVNDGKISFKSDEELGSIEVTDTIYLNITDAIGNMAAFQPLQVQVIATDNMSPQVTVGPGLAVEEGGRRQLTRSHIQAVDSDSSISNIRVVIDAQPTVGTLKLITSPTAGSSVVTHQVESFRLTDLYSGVIYYEQSDHTGTEPRNDFFWFHITDGINPSPITRFNISIIPVNDEKPQILTDFITATEGYPRNPITNASIYVADIDSEFDMLSSDQFIFTLTKPPREGHIIWSENRSVINTGQHFSMLDIHMNNLAYLHIGREHVETDIFEIEVTDGQFTDRQSVSVKIILVDDETPRVKINDGIKLKAGQTRPILSTALYATDIDSNDSDIIYTITQLPRLGHLVIMPNDRERETADKITPKHIENGDLKYIHTEGNRAGLDYFKFDVEDPQANKLVDQTFYIEVVDDAIFPVVRVNSRLVVEEDGSSAITSSHLFIHDDQVKPKELLISINKRPEYGDIVLVDSEGVAMSVDNFTMQDVLFGRVIYIHESESEETEDQFSFSASDGFNNVSQTFSIRINQKDDSLPELKVDQFLTVREGHMIEITDRVIKARDNDTKDDMLLISLAEPPSHGDILVIEPGANEAEYNPCLSFTYEDLLAGKVFYRHDGSETTSDSFKIVLSDQTNSGFMMTRNNRLFRTTSPLTVDVLVHLLDDQKPVITVNKGLKHLQPASSDQITGEITEEVLSSEDGDTEIAQIKYQITEFPQYGSVVKSTSTDPISTFTQADINSGLIRYMLHDVQSSTEDFFKFTVQDTSVHNEGSGEVQEDFPTDIFNISWSFVSFNATSLEVQEEDGVIEIPIVRRGCIDQSISVDCSVHLTDSEQHKVSLIVLTPQVTIPKNTPTGVCRVKITNDSIYKITQIYTLELSDPVRSLLGEDNSIQITVTDNEDEPIVQFDQSLITVDENVGVVSIPIIRSGDLSQPITVQCSTESQTADGSSNNQLLTGNDFIGLESVDIVFNKNQTKAFCNVTIIDDTLYELKEEFEVVLTGVTSPVLLGKQSAVSVVIRGPNDASPVEMTRRQVYVFEDEEYVSVKLRRQGPDLSSPLTVWCTTEMYGEQPAQPGVDYTPISQAITFKPGQSEADCMVVILDDTDSPLLEGEESFLIKLASADPLSQLTEFDSTVVIIDDIDLDVPQLQFDVAKLTVNEDSGTLSVPIIRQGDLSCHVSVICYTRQQSAKAGIDFTERPLTNLSRVDFYPGVKNASCELTILDDTIYEESEYLLLRIAEPLGCESVIGNLDMMLITITDTEDVPRVSMDATSYTVEEPTESIQEVVAAIELVRSGDLNQTSSLRIYTLDRSAVSGIDYMSTSQYIQFKYGEKSKVIRIPILHNSEVEWHETFEVTIGDLMGVFSGDNMTATVNIMDGDVAASIVLPSTPMVVSLHDLEESNHPRKSDSASSGYPLICVSPCERSHPDYYKTVEKCQKNGINTTAMTYNWELSYPVYSSGGLAPFATVSQATSLSRVDTRLLETFYFRPGFKVRCVATPIHKDGKVGIPLRSAAVSIKPRGVCMSESHNERTILTTGAQSFMAKLQYIDSGENSNKIHVSVEIPHQDGMLPIISTLPIHNIDHLLSHNTYRKQHLCSNIVNQTELSNMGEQLSPSANFLSAANAPSQQDNVRIPQAQMFYRHLDKHACLWRFEAWFEVDELVNTCGARMTSNFDVESAYKSFVTVFQPLYVSYIYAQAPRGWVSLDHQTELQVSFYYDNSKFASGVDIYQPPRGTAELMRLGINSDGKLTLQIKTHAQFHGMFVSTHRTAGRDTTSELAPPNDVDTEFKLDLIWTQPTLEQPQQVWRAVSEYSLQDYTGVYTLNLLACISGPSSVYNREAESQKCAVEETISIPLSIAFQQIIQPVPIKYSLNTEIQLTNSKQLFLMDSEDISVDSSSADFSGVFSKGDQVYGRVYWSDDHDLSSALQLQLEKVFICTGKNGYVPTYDPEGTIYNNGAQYGCLEPSSKLKHRFMVLDRGADYMTIKSFNSLPFRAEFTDMNTKLQSNPLTDTNGFVMNVDPLFTETSGQRWHVHILYKVVSPDTSLYGRKKRAVEQLGNNLISLNLANADHQESSEVTVENLDTNSNSHRNKLTKILVPFVLFFLIVILIVVLVVKRRTVVRYVNKHKTKKVKDLAAAADLYSSLDLLPPINRTESIYLNSTETPEFGDSV